MAVATLGIEVKYDSVEKATESLGDFTDAASKAEKSATDLKGKADGATDGMDKLAKESDSAGGALDKVKNSMFGTTGAADLLKGALAGAAAAFSVKAIINMGDAWSDMQSRVGAAIGDMSRAGDLMQRLVDVANASYSPLSQTVEIYGRNVAVLRDLGRGANEAADFTEALNHALVLTATKGQQAESVQNALSKAMAVGKLQAQGLETVLANGGEVAQLLADQLGTTVSGLRQMATDGKITGDVIAESLIGNLDILRERAAEMPATVGDAFVRIQTNVLAFIGTLDQSVGATGALADILLTVADNIDRILVTVATATLAIGTYYVAAAAGAALATVTWTTALNFLRTALIRTGIGLIVIAAGELVYQFMRLIKATGGWGEAFRLLGNVVSEVWSRMTVGAQVAQKNLNSVWEGIKSAFFNAVAAMQLKWSDFLFRISAGLAMIPGMDGISGDVNEYAIKAGSSYLELEGSAKKATEAAKAYNDEAAAMGEKNRAPLESLAALSAALEKAASDQDKLLNPVKPPPGTPPPPGGGGGGGGGAEDTAASQLQAELEARLQALRDYFYTEQELIAQQRAEHLETLELARQAEMLSQAEYNDYKLMVERDYQQKMQALRAQEIAGALDATSDFFGAMSSLQAGGNERMLKLQKIFSAASALVNTYTAASQVLADPTIPFWGKFAAVAAVIAKGMSLVAAIKSGSSTASSGGGGATAQAPSAAPAATPVSQMQAVEIKLHGEVFNRETVAELIDKINDMGKDGYNLVVRTA